MGTIDQPKPSSPGAPQPEQAPLQPGHAERSGLQNVRTSRPNPRTPEESQREVHGNKS
jgi:hypothetical protein